jgi:hypothetical protein
VKTARQTHAGLERKFFHEIGKAFEGWQAVGIRSGFKLLGIGIPPLKRRAALHLPPSRTAYSLAHLTMSEGVGVEMVIAWDWTTRLPRTTQFQIKPRFWSEDGSVGNDLSAGRSVEKPCIRPRYL